MELEKLEKFEKENVRKMSAKKLPPPRDVQSVKIEEKK